MSNDLASYLADKRFLVERHLRASVGAVDDCPATLMEAMRYGLLAPGKRVRPILVILAAEASGGSGDKAMPAACAVEMVHAYSLIHDDLPAMDDDDLRRGQLTCHKKFGEALAILAGDALLTLAFQVLAEGYLPATAAAACRELARGAGAAGMVGGQMEDLAWEKQSGAGAATFADLEKVHARKTGALFRACLRLGVLAAQGERPEGLEPDLVDALDRYGQCFGQAFQIVDDLLDVEGTEAETGKRVHKDANRGKLTYPGLLGHEESRRRAELLCRQACECVAPLGTAGQRLAELIDQVRSRKR